MKRNMKRMLSLALVLAMVLSSFSFAQSPFEQYAELGAKAEKMIGFEDINLESELSVRVIVELYAPPVIEAATAKGLHMSEMNLSEVATLTNRLEKGQATALGAIQKNVGKIEVHEKFVNVFNGISMTVPAMSVEAIANTDGVKAVYIANEYLRPEPQMTTSHQITKSKYVNEELGYKGEGLVVAIIDTGLDPYHQDFNIDAEAMDRIALTETQVNSTIAQKGLVGKYYNTKVPYGYNYMDKDSQIKDIAPDASMHGMHVGGTVAANGLIKGVAPNAQLLALKVFGNDPDFPSTYSDIIIAAVDDGIALGAHVMNLSLGATAGNVNRQDPEQMAITRAVENGILMSISAGNSGWFGKGWTNQYGYPKATNPDIGVTGSPSLVAESLSVASVENFMELNAYEVSHPAFATPLLGYSNLEWVNGNYEMVALKGNKIGIPSNFEGVDVAGKVVLVSRGNAFVDTANTAKERGAIGVILYNLPGRDMVTSLIETSIPMIMIPAQGVQFEQIIINEGGTTTVGVNFKSGIFSATAGKISGFSSWGTTPDMGFKPDIAAPGGNIYSTLENNQYGIMSGTSMAAPHAAGGAALVYQRLLATGDFTALIQTNEEKAKLAKAILMNTARPIVDYDYGTDIDDSGSLDHWVTYTSPRSQGAGSMDLKSAMHTDVVVYSTESGRNYQASYNAGTVTDGFNYNLTAYNQGTQPAFFSLDAVVQTNIEDSGFNVLESMILLGTSVTFKVNGEAVTAIEVPAGGTTEIEVIVDLANATLADSMKPFNVAYPNGNFVEGFVFFYPQEDLNNSAYEALRLEYLTALEALLEAQETLELNLELLEAAELALEEAQAAYDEALALKVAKEAFDAATLALEEAQEARDAFVAEYGDVQSLEAQIIAVHALQLAKELVETLEAAVAVASGELEAAELVLAGLQAELDVVLARIVELEKIIPGTKPPKEKRKLEAELAAKIVERDALLAQITPASAYVEVKEAALLQLQSELATAQIELEAAEIAAESIELTLEELNALLIEVAVLENAVAEALAALALLSGDFTDEELELIESIEELEATLSQAQEAYEALMIELGIVELIATYKVLLAAANSAEAALLAGDYNFRDALPLSVPFISFKGDWTKAPAFDGKRGTAASYYNLTSLLFNNSAADAGYFMPAAMPVFQPNGNGKRESISSIFSLNRNLVDLRYEIQNADGDTIHVMGMEASKRKNYYDGGRQSYYYYQGHMVWDGKIAYETAPDGWYDYVIKGKLAEDTRSVHEIRFPVMLDITAPTFKSIQWGENVTVVFEDNLSGISHYALFTYGDSLDNPLKLAETNNLTGIFNLAKHAKTGDYLVFVAYDYAGNIGTKIVQVKDGLADVIVTTPEFFSMHVDQNILFKGTVTDTSPTTLTIDGQKVAYKDGTSTPGTASFEHLYTAKADGLQEVYVEATDISGNPYGHSRKFFIDSVAPEVEVLEVTVDGTPVVITNGVMTLPAAASAMYVKVRAKDNYPDLEIRINESLVEQVSSAWYYTNSLLVEKEIINTYKVVLNTNRTSHPLVVSVLDAGGWKTVVGYTAYNAGTTGENIFANKTEIIKPVIPEGGSDAGGRIGQSFSLAVTPPTGGGTVAPPATGNQGSTGTGTSANNETVVFEEQETPLGAVKFAQAYIDGYKTIVDNKEVRLFKPENNVTRAEFAKMLAAVLELELAEGDVKYADANGKWFTGSVKALVDAKILLGYENGTFKPEQAITRAEIAQALANAWTFKGVEVAAFESALTDIADHAAFEAISKLNGAGVINGYANKTFRPDNTATRAETVKMINTFIGRQEADVTTSSKFADVAGHWALKYIEAAASEAVVTASN